MRLYLTVVVSPTEDVINILLEVDALESGLDRVTMDFGHSEVDVVVVGAIKVVAVFVSTSFKLELMVVMACGRSVGGIVNFWACSSLDFLGGDAVRLLLLPASSL